MADIKITDLTAYTDPVSTDVLPIVDVSNDLTKKVSIADLLENAGTGSATAPSFSFDGDNNTGVYRPGAGQLAISTNGTGRLYVDSSGNVGIGTNNPLAKLGVNGDDLGSTAGDSVSLGRFLGATNTTTGGNNSKFSISHEREIDGTDWTTSSIRLQRVVDATPMQYIDFTAVRGTNTDARDIAFGNSGTERMRITTNGNVGIGASSPSEKLDIGGNVRLTGQLYQSMPSDFWSQGTTFIELAGLGNLTHMGSLETCLTSNGYRDSNTQWKSYGINGYTGAAQVRLNPQGIVVVGTESNKANGSSHIVQERLRIDSSGNVGIGISDPLTKLVISDATAGTAINRTSMQLLRNNWGGQISGFIIPGDSAGLTFSTVANKVPTERMRLKNNGYVGIGTENPQAKLQVAGDVMVDSGFITLNGNKLGAIRVTIADDAFATITPPRVGAGHISVVEGGDEQFPASGCHGFVYADWGNSPAFASISVGTQFEVSNAGPPNGTTGSDAHATLFVGGTSGVVYLENRLSGSRAFFVNFL